MKVIPEPYMLMRDTRPMLGTTVAGIICERCGYLRLHAAKALTDENA
jgi:hypothetical protein